LKLLAPVSLAGQYSVGTPVVDHGMAFVASYSLNGRPGRLEAFSTTCLDGGPDAKRACSPLWTAVIGRYAGGTVTVADGLVFAGGDNGADPPSPRLYAFPERCGQNEAVCEPLWHAGLPGSGELQASPTVSDGVVYVPAGSAGSAYLFAFPVHCRVETGMSCTPLWRGRLDLGDAFEPVAVSNGFAYVPDYDGFIYGFKLNCKAKGGVCDPAWLGDTNELGPSPVAVADGLVFVGSQDENVYAFNASGCRSEGGVCPPAWTGDTGSNVRSAPAVAYGTVFLTSDDGHIYAFPEHCPATCEPKWTGTVGAGPLDSRFASPSVANGVVYVSSSNGGGQRALLAFPALCGVGQHRCQPLWKSDADSYYVFEGPAIAGGRLYLTAGPAAGPGELFVFGLAGT
jgi:outer membrane protein assembly factor BamB